MPPRFFFAVGTGRYDLQLAQSVGQTDILVRVGSSLLPHLRGNQAFSVIEDSAAYPPNNPHRPTLPAYIADLARWHPDQTDDHNWSNLWFAAGYDHIGDAGRTQHDYNTLMGELSSHQIECCPVVPVLQFPTPDDAMLHDLDTMRQLGIAAAESILLDYAKGWAGTHWDIVDGDGDLFRPTYAIGGLVPALSPNNPAYKLAAVEAWYSALIEHLEAQTSDTAETGDADLGVVRYPASFLSLHLFGIAQPFYALRSPLVVSVDSAGPAIQAKYGWPNIAPTYNPNFGISAAKLQQSRAARLVYWIIKYRVQLGLSWTPVDAERLPNDRVAPAHVQHGLFDMPPA